MIDVAAVVARIQAAPHRQQTLLVAIDGRGGCGKSTLAAHIAEHLAGTSVVHLDDFAYPETDRARLLRQVLAPLKADQPARYQRFDWKTKQLAEWVEIAPGGVVIVEGVSTLHPLLRDHYDFRVWLECPPEVGFKRGLHRDQTVFGADTTDEWLNTWMPEERAYIATHRPEECADMVVDGSEMK